MTLITPDTNIRLIKLPIELDLNNQLDFASATAQFNYFNSLTYIEEENATYQRQDGTIRYPACRDDIIEYNYCMYQNHAYGNKWFYAFITSMDYLNNEVTAVHIKTDVWQTWQFDLEFKSCFVERTHVSSDAIGSHTLPENLNIGDYVMQGIDEVTELTTTYPVLASSVNPDDTSNIVTGIYSGQPTGCRYYCYIPSTGTASTHDLDTLADDIQYLIDDGKEGAIIGVFSAPGWLVNGGVNKDIGNSSQPAELTYNLSAFANLGGSSESRYIPKNNKMFTYPYCYYLITNGGGGSIVLQPELFTGTKQLSISGVLCPGCSIVAIPKNYNYKEYAIEEMLTLGKYPELSYNGDLFTNWQTVNAVNQNFGYINGATEIVGGALGIASTVATGGQASFDTGGSLFGGIESVTRTMYNEYLASRVPPTFGGNINSGDIIASRGDLTFRIMKMSLKRENAIIIDSYFEMYGYKYNRVNIPNFKSRRYWNYIKTIGCNIHAYAPQEDIQEIKNMFDHGLTIWHDSTHFLDYTQTNSII